MGRMAIQDFFSDEERERQAAIAASWEAGLSDLASPEVLERLRQAMSRLPVRDDLTPRQRLRQEAMERSAESARETVQNPELMAWLRSVLERLDQQPLTPTHPMSLWNAARGGAQSD
jgi:DNA-binding transcriptional regulator YbjK